VPAQRSSSSENVLLAWLTPDDRALLDPHLEAVPLKTRDVLAHANLPIQHVYFPLQGLASIISGLHDQARLEVGLFGRDGMSAPSLLLGVDRTPHETFIQAPGAALRMPADAFTAAFQQSSSLHDALLKYVHVLSIQTAHTAVANGVFIIEERLARWLLMCHDRLEGDALPLTHEFLALMLAVRRPGVTVAIQILESAGLIRAERGLITIRDRARLEEVADGSYGSPEAEYERLIAPLRRQGARA